MLVALESASHLPVAVYLVRFLGLSAPTAGGAGRSTWLICQGNGHEWLSMRSASVLYAAFFSWLSVSI
jgi:hypothetical protein